MSMNVVLCALLFGCIGYLIGQSGYGSKENNENLDND